VTENLEGLRMEPDPPISVTHSITLNAPPTPSPKVSCLDDVAPQRRAVTLKHLRTTDGRPVTVWVEAQNFIELLIHRKRLPGLVPGQVAPTGKTASKFIEEHPEAFGDTIYPAVISGAYLVDGQGQPMRPTFSLEYEPGKLCVRGMALSDLLRIIETMNALSPWKEDQAAEAEFPDHTNGRADGAGALQHEQGVGADPVGAASGSEPAV